MLKHTLIKFIITLTLAITLSNCQSVTEENIDCTTYDYSDCNTVQPIYGLLTAKISKNPNGGKVIIKIYEGKFQNQDPIYTDSTKETEYQLALDVNKYYSATAHYSKNSNNIIAVDGDKITRTEKIKCDSSCWEVKNATLDLRLK